ncbi:MAG TPA: SCO family protein [Symbiobacteriaceae bacterium]|jgi:protein SCO1/2|nr:SCO family protein [Symbiobacteriaceae bacterium]
MAQSAALPRWVRPALAAAVTVAAVAAAGLLWLQTRSAAAEGLPTYGTMPAFELVDQTGKPVTANDLKGKVLAVGFIYTSCTDICPMLTSQMRGLQENLQQAGLLGSQVELISISVDPERDTPDRLAEYAGEHGADTATWRFLTGPVAMIKDVVVSGFLVGMEKAPMRGPAGHEGHTAAAATAEPYEVNHSGRIVLVDKAGNLRAFYDGAALDPVKVIADIKQLR